jgi:ubiquinone/menaquinone biosynthesis C-methylase UbiE
VQRDVDLPGDRENRFHILELYERHRNDELIKYLPYRPGLIVLACRCGDGVLLSQLREQTRAVWGVDPSLRAIKCALQRQVSVATCEGLPFLDRAFDAAVGYEVLGQARDPARTLCECARVLRPGGVLVSWESRRLRRALDTVGLEEMMGVAGFTLGAQEPFSYVAYPAAVVASKVPLLARSRSGAVAIKGLLAIDGLLARIPALQSASRHRIIVAEKGVP